MNYKILNHRIEKENGVAVRELLTLEATYANGSTTTHNHVFPAGGNLKEEATSFAAQLEGILEEPKAVTIEDVEVKEKDREVKEADVVAKLAELTP